MLNRLLPFVEESEWLRSKLEILVLQALALQATCDLPGALAQLALVLTLAEPDRYVRLLVGEGAPMRALLLHLRKAQQKDDHPKVAVDYVNELLAVLDEASPPAPQERLEKSAKLLIEPLAERELDVLQCMAGGLANPEIAEELIVAISTVRTHIKNIYGKLAVRNRVEAVTQAHTLQLLCTS